jgi:hypothetical protein
MSPKYQSFKQVFIKIEVRTCHVNSFPHTSDILLLCSNFSIISAQWGWFLALSSFLKYVRHWHYSVLNQINVVICAKWEAIRERSPENGRKHAFVLHFLCTNACEWPTGRKSTVSGLKARTLGIEHQWPSACMASVFLICNIGIHTVLASGSPLGKWVDLSIFKTYLTVPGT